LGERAPSTDTAKGVQEHRLHVIRLDFLVEDLRAPWDRVRSSTRPLTRDRASSAAHKPARSREPRCVGRIASGEHERMRFLMESRSTSKIWTDSASSREYGFTDPNRVRCSLEYSFTASRHSAFVLRRTDPPGPDRARLFSGVPIHSLTAARTRTWHPSRRESSSESSGWISTI
jgi:hypothetical protein